MSDISSPSTIPSTDTHPGISDVYLETQKIKTDGSKDDGGFQITVGYQDADGNKTVVAAMSIDPPAAMPIDQMILNLTAITSTLQEARAKGTEQSIKMTQDDLSQQYKKQLEDILHQIEEIAKQKKAHKNSGIWGWVATTVAAVAIVATVVSGGAAIVLVPMILSFAVGLTQQIMDQSGFLEDLAKKNPKMAKQLGLALMITQISLAVFSLGAGAASASSLAAKGPKVVQLILSAKLMSSVAEAGSQAARMLTIARLTVALMEAGTDVGKGFAIMEEGKATKKADDAQAETKRTEADITEVRAYLADYQKVLEEIYKAINDLATRRTAMIQSQHDGTTKQLNSMA